MTELNRLIDKAEKDISKILEKLEIDTAQVISSIGITDVNIYVIGDKEKILRHIKIDMHRFPGTKWA